MESSHPEAGDGGGGQGSPVNTSEVEVVEAWADDLAEDETDGQAGQDASEFKLIDQDEAEKICDSMAAEHGAGKADAQAKAPASFEERPCPQSFEGCRRGGARSCAGCLEGCRRGGARSHTVFMQNRKWAHCPRSTVHDLQTHKVKSTVGPQSLALSTAARRSQSHRVPLSTVACM